MKGALVGFLDFTPLHVSRPKFSYPKGFLMLKKALALIGAVSLGLVTSASAALTAADVPMTDAKADITLVFLAILGVAVVIFGYRKIMSLIGR